MTSSTLTIPGRQDGSLEEPLLKHPFNMIVCGQSGSGKTSFIHRILARLDELCSCQFQRVIYAYGIFQPLYREIGAIPRVQMHEGCPRELPATGEPTLLIMDDLFLETNKETAALFTRMRHLNLSVVFVTHNFFHDCRYMRTVTRNAHYLVFFRNPRDASQLAHLSRQMYPGNGRFLPDAMAKATREPYSYLMIDLKPTTSEELRVRSGALPGENLVFYCPA